LKLIQNQETALCIVPFSPSAYFRSVLTSESRMKTAKNQTLRDGSLSHVTCSADRKVKTIQCWNRECATDFEQKALQVSVLGRPL